METSTKLRLTTLMKIISLLLKLTVHPTKWKLKKPVAPKPVTRPAAAPKTESGKPVVSRPAATSNKSAVKSPLPGIILEIKVKVGDTVKKGDTVLILEAMKMENNIHADKDGKVTAINVNNGDSVLEGTDLIIIE
jgi:Biotin carboxyl carrier protein